MTSDFSAQRFGQIGPVTVLVDGYSSTKKCSFCSRWGHAWNGVIFLLIEILAGERSDLLHDGFEKALSDLPGRKPGYLSIDHCLDELARGDTDACFKTISDAFWKTR